MMCIAHEQDCPHCRVKKSLKTYNEKHRWEALSRAMAFLRPDADEKMIIYTANAIQARLAGRA